MILISLYGGWYSVGKGEGRAGGDSVHAKSTEARDSLNMGVRSREE